jgi:hypothetical protein
MSEAISGFLPHIADAHAGFCNGHREVNPFLLHPLAENMLLRVPSEKPVSSLLRGSSHLFAGRDRMESGSIGEHAMHDHGKFARKRALCTARRALWVACP